MSNLWFHAGGTPDLFLITCAAISVTAAVVAVRNRRKRSTKSGSVSR